MFITERKQIDVYILRMTEEQFDEASADRLKLKVKKILSEGAQKIILDYHKQDFLDPAGVQCLLDCEYQISRSNAKLILCGVSEFIKLHLDVAGILSTFTICYNQAHAIASFKNEPATT